MPRNRKVGKAADSNLESTVHDDVRNQRQPSPDDNPEPVPALSRKQGQSRARVENATQTESKRLDYKSANVEDISEETAPVQVALSSDGILENIDDSTETMNLNNDEESGYGSDSEWRMRENARLQRQKAAQDESDLESLKQALPDIANYEIVMPELTDTMALVLRFPGRKPDQPYCARYGQKPLEFRIKPKCGLVEVDVPFNIHYNWDKEKAIMYGEATRKSKLLQEGGSYGMGGGLGVGLKPPSKTKPSNNEPAPFEPSVEKLLENFDDANNKGHVMNRITFSGQIYPREKHEPRYMLGTFKNSKWPSKVYRYL